MKNIFLTLIAILSLVACSSDDDSSSNSSELETQLLGKWLFENPNNNPTINNSFTFSSSGNVTYSYWDGGQGNNYDSETGVFSFSGDIMTMTFPEDVSLTFVQKVIFINENVVEFQETGVTGENAYDGDYFREGATNYNSNNGMMKIIFDTGNVLNSAWGSSCYGLSSETENINTKLVFLSDGEEINSYDYSMLPGYQVDKEEAVIGNILSAKLTLEDFNANVLDKDIHIYDISVSIENEEGEIVLNESLGELYYCTDSRYEVTFTYNVDNDTFSIEEQTHSF
ncbi:hypothetical protein [Winogradskyella wichelsiae]|uniref:hypothetical protein n=1 Tax=Winogradskyella wichelsiae TaxID=2697007 RepID=UPI0015C6AF91|nr:hypothetical protein [Winogradskyella wichelsiae]